MLIQQIRDSITKQSLLKNQDGWKNILMDVPPILWFGNMESDKPKIVTIGANPSNREFFSLKGKAYHRFNYSAINPYNPIELEHAYNNYFNNLPYRGWFGSEKGTKVEAFLHGLDASYYDNTDKKYQAIHIDFFPFATYQKFRDIKKITEKSLFQTNWTNDSIRDLLDCIKPELIVIFGRNENIHYFLQYVKDIVANYPIPINQKKIQWNRWTKDKLDKKSQSMTITSNYYIGIPNKEGFPPIIFLSTYLGNPMGFSPEDLYELAEYIIKS